MIFIHSATASDLVRPCTANVVEGFSLLLSVPVLIMFLREIERRGSMNEPVYTISQASSLVGKKSYVLRYWEEELAIPIARNELGHRYYTGNDIQLFLNIKELQKRGLQLRAIKSLIPKLYYQEPGSQDSPVKLLPGETSTVSQTSQESYIPLENSIPMTSLDEYKMQEFQSILEKLISQGLEEQKVQNRESRIRSLDHAIRTHQESRRQAAAAKTSRKIQKSKRKRK